MDRKKLMYIGIILIITVILSVTYFSYAFFTSTSEQHGKLNVVVGTLDYKIECEDLTNNQITLAAGESKELNIKITSLNNINSNYELYYTTDNNDVQVGYSIDTVDQTSGTINKNQTKMIKVVIRNNTSSSATVTLGTQGGFLGKNLMLEEGHNSINTQLKFCRYGIGNVVKEAGYTGIADLFTVPCDGNYKIELWGAQGATYSSRIGGYGSYVSGNVHLNENANLYIYVGQGGANYATTLTYGTYIFNGGGYGNFACYVYHNYQSGYDLTGGGSTDIRINNGNWNDSLSLNSRIMVAAGGGAANYGTNGTSGGGISGYNGTVGTAGTQISAGGPKSGGFGYGGSPTYNGTVCNDNEQTGAGSGYYGGGASSATGTLKGSTSTPGSGSSFISGHTGCVAIAEGSTSEPRAVKISGCTTGTTNMECSKHYSGLVFTNTKMIDGSGYSWTNAKSALEAMPNPAGGYYASSVGHTGDGYARITYLGD